VIGRVEPRPGFPDEREIGTCFDVERRREKTVRPLDIDRVLERVAFGYAARIAEIIALRWARSSKTVLPPLAHQSLISFGTKSVRQAYGAGRSMSAFGASPTSYAVRFTGAIGGEADIENLWVHDLAGKAEPGARILHRPFRVAGRRDSHLRSM
jgi:hypothetical protein